jgi:16S rRNA (uracil1498-N3)-methyltransferase
MPATPAWPPKSLPRLFVRQALAEGTLVNLDAAQANYLGNVMRLKEGSELLVFDGSSGEWLARVAAAGKKRMTLAVERKAREPEMGATRLIPVMTQRTVAERVKLERLEAIAIEAAEQCGRTRLPELSEPITLKDLLSTRDQARRLYFADEGGGEPAAVAFKPGPALILVGPEGGFTDEERSSVRAAEHAVAISLGPRILRAETAALASLSAYMALAGDWR